MNSLREHQLEYCLVCKNRKFDSKKGVVCSLTGAHATFGSTCDDFLLDKKAEARKKQQDEQKAEDELENQTFGLNSFGIKSQTIAGLVIASLSFILLILGISIFERIFFILILFFILGLVITFRGLMKNKKSKSRDEQLIDQL